MSCRSDWDKQHDRARQSHPDGAVSVVFDHCLGAGGERFAGFGLMWWAMVECLGKKLEGSIVVVLLLWRTYD